MEVIEVVIYMNGYGEQIRRVGLGVLVGYLEYPLWEEDLVQCQVRR
jgi:hypothetical protein